MNDTPRTDHAEKACRAVVGGAVIHGVVTAAFARELEREIERLRGELSGMKQDAERYYFLRAHAEKAVSMGIGEFWSIRMDPLIGESFNAAIDAARRKL